MILSFVSFQEVISAKSGRGRKLRFQPFSMIDRFTPRPSCRSSTLISTVRSGHLRNVVPDWRGNETIGGAGTDCHRRHELDIIEKVNGVPMPPLMLEV